MANKDDEQVLGVPRDRIIGEDGWYGIRDDGVGRYLGIIEAEGEFRRRGDAEDDPAWKQVIPYLLLRDDTQLFLMRRTKAGGDVRLHERWSVGVGGHLNPEDGDIHGGLLREFSEELVAEWEPEPRLVGLLNDDSTPVGRVHLGVVYSADAAGRAVDIRETEKLSGAFADVSTVREGYGFLETWSQIVFDFVTDGTDRRDRETADSAWGGIIERKE